MKAVVLVKRSDIFILEKVGEVEYTPETYQEKVEKLKELLARVHVE